MSCEVQIYQVELNDNDDVLLKYKQTVVGYDFLDYLYNMKIGYNSIKYGDLLTAFRQSGITPEFDINRDYDYVIDVSY